MSLPGLVARCPAKVNLSLSVGARRSDGYHEVRTVFQAVDLWDTLTAFPAKRLTLVSDHPSVPDGPTNLIQRAAESLRRAGGVPEAGAELRLRKRIPVSGGMGGGSSDAAAALVLLGRLWDVCLESEQILELAATLGADVPFFLHGGTALGVGKGDRISPLPFHGERFLLLGTPPFGISTGEAYEAFDRQLTRSEGNVSVSRLSDDNFRDENHFRIGENDLEAVVFERWPKLLQFRDELLRSGASMAMLSGSGSTVYGMFEDPGALPEAAARLAQRFGEWRLIESRTVASGILVGEAGEAD